MPAVKQRLARLHPENHTLHAIYYDTPDRDLARELAALRIRLENDKWVQTLKMAGPDELSKIEINHGLTKPELDLRKYRGQKAERLFKHISRHIKPRYETRVQRQTALLSIGSSTIEIALDEGEIIAGDARLAISEIEFELVSGDVAALFEVGESWLNEFQLLIELRSKSERGDVLAKKMLSGELNDYPNSAMALAQRSYKLPKHSFNTVDTMQACYVQSASLYLNQVIRNAAFLGGIDAIQPTIEQQAQYLTAMRVGMRRLRSCRRLFRQWMTADEKKLSRTLRGYFALFGDARDHDLLQLEMLPKLRKAGVPGIEHATLPALPTTNPELTAASVDFQACLLRSLKQLVTQRCIVKNAPSGHELYSTLHKLLAQQLGNIQVASIGFTQLSTRHQHRLRNWIKSMRYCLDFLGRSEHADLADDLRTAQHALGKITDLDVTIDWAREAIDDPEARGYALGWLTARRQYKQKQSLPVLKNLIQARYPVYAANKKKAAPKARA